MEKLLLILPFVYLLYASGGNFTEKAAHQAVTFQNNEDPAKLIIGKWQVTAIEGEEKNLQSLPEPEKTRGKKTIEILQQIVSSTKYEFTKKGTYKQFAGDKIDEQGQYELRMKGKELVFKAEGAQDSAVELTKLTASEMVMRMEVPLSENGHKLVVIYKLKK